jgi:1-acyl-sn-glycerol-3-phosphate acyltransferase
MLEKIVLISVRTLYKLYNRIEMRGLEKIPLRGPLIIAANHLSNADPLALVAYASLIRKTNVLAKSELFDFPPLGAFVSMMGGLPVDRKKAGGDIGAFRKSIAVLKGNGCLVMFPEGTRLKGRILKPKSGISLIAHKTRASVLPVRIFNSENSLKLGKIVMKFGNLKTFNPEKGSNMKKAYSDFSEDLMKDIYSIKNDNT